MKWIRSLFAVYLFISVPSVQSSELSLKLDSGTEKKHLLELFSSEGCSSCPPADRFVSQLQDSSTLWNHWVPVVYQVGYWDYLGWPDPFAKPEHQQRQYAYRTAGRSKGVYTPGFFIDGQEWRAFFRPNRSLPDLKEEEAGRLTASVSAPEKKEATLNISAEFLAINQQSESYLLHWAVTGMDRETQVNRGENSRKTLHHDFVVLESGRSDANSGQWTISVPLKKQADSNSLAISLWVTPSNDPFDVLQATGGLIQ